MIDLNLFNKFLLKATGTPIKALKYANNDNKNCADAFFKPYKSPADFCIRTATIFSAPIASAILAVEALVLSIFLAFKALDQVCMGYTTETANQSSHAALICLIGMFAAVISAFTSWLVNLVDLIGGGVASIKDQCQEEELQFQA